MRSPTHSATPVDGVLLCPCFLEAGRLTVDDVQWVAEDDRLVPSARTTYATDRSFGYAGLEPRAAGSRRRRAGPCPPPTC